MTEPNDLERLADEAASEGNLEEAERLRGLVRQREAEAAARLVIATKGETINYDHLGKVLAERLRLKEKP